MVLSVGVCAYGVRGHGVGAARAVVLVGLPIGGAHRQRRVQVDLGRTRAGEGAATEYEGAGRAARVRAALARRIDRGRDAADLGVAGVLLAADGVGGDRVVARAGVVRVDAPALGERDR